MEKEVAKKASQDRRKFLDSQNVPCQHEGCGQPRRLHNAFAHSAYRVTDHKYVGRDDIEKEF